MKLKNSAVALALSVVLLVGSTSVTTASTLSTKKLSLQLLRVSQLPVGSRTATIPDSGVGCLKNLLVPKGVRQTAMVRAFFDYKGGLPVLDEELATYSNAALAYKKIIATINGCHVVTGTSATGHHVTGTVARMSFPRFGNASSTYAMSLTSLGITLHYDYLIARKGNVVAGILEADVGLVSSGEFKGLVAKALANIR